MSEVVNETLDLRMGATTSGAPWDATSASRWGAAVRWGMPDDVPVALVVLDAAGNVVDRNRVADDLLYDGSHGLLRVGAPFMTLVSHPVREYAKWRKRDTDELLEARLRVGSRLLPVVLAKRPISSDPSHTMLAIVMHDQASQVDAHRVAFDVASAGVFVTETSGRILVVNPALVDIMHLGHDELVGQDWQRSFLAGVPPEVRHRVHEELASQGEWRGRVVRAVPELGDRLLDLTLRMRSPERSSNEVISRAIVGEVLDVTEGRSVELALKEQARRDELTGLLNRAGFMTVLDKRFAAAQRGGSSLTLLYLDLDNFKSLNDHFGHRYGDILLEAFAGRLRSSLKSSDVIGRLGGDEFAVLFDPGLPPETLETVVGKLRDKLIQDYQLDELTYACTASFGSADYPWDAASRSELVEYADHAMYQAKRGGRNAHARFDRRVFRDLAAHEDVIEAIDHAIDNDQIVPYYQPIFAAKSGELIGAEALVRWIEPETRGGIHLPADFLPLIDGNVVGIRMTIQMLDQVVGHLTSFAEINAAITISVNLSTAQLRADDVVSHLERLAVTSPDEVGRLRIELTEDSFIDKDPIIGENMARIAAAGAVLSLSGFGRSHASILSLKAFEFGQLKLDRRAMATLSANPHDRLVTESLIELCRKLEIETVTEGIETTAQLNYVQGLGCDLAQGFLLSHPMPCDEFNQLLSGDRPTRKRHMSWSPFQRR